MDTLKIRNVLFLFLNFNLLYSSAALAVDNFNQSFTVDGQLFQTSSDEPLLDSNVTIIVQILDPSKKCILLEEEHNQINTTTQNGRYSIAVGSPVGAPPRSTNDPGRKMSEIFQNSNDIPATSVPGQTCVDSIYKPAANDARFLRLTVIPSSTNVPDTLAPDTILGSVPSALVAQTLQGLDSSQLLKLNASTLTQNNVESIFNRFTKLDAILNKFDADATNITTNAATATTITGNLPATQITGLADVAKTGNYNDLANKPAAVPSLTGNTGKFLTTDGTNLSWATVSVANATAGDDQKFMKYVNGSGWQPYFVTLSDIKNSTGTGLAFNMGACTSAKTLLWSSITDEFNCQDISIPATKVTGLADVAKTASYNDLVDKPWTAVTGGISYMGGNIGVGLNDPYHPIDVMGIINSHEGIQAEKTGAEVYPQFKTIAITNDGYPQWITYRARGVSWDPADILPVQNNDIVGSMMARAHNGSDFEDMASMQFVVDNTNVTGSGNHPGGRIDFLTRASSDTDPFYLSKKVMTIRNNGSVGIGAEAPDFKSKLLVKGTIANDVPAPIVGPNVDLSLGNTLILTNVGGSTINLSNMIHGGSYTLVVQDMNSRTYTFSGCANSKFLPTNSNTIENTHTIYTILTVTNGVDFDCYITWTTGY